MWLCCQNQMPNWIHKKVHCKHPNEDSSDHVFDHQKEGLRDFVPQHLDFHKSATLCWIGSAGTFTSEGRSDRASLLADLHNHSIHCFLWKTKWIYHRKNGKYHVESHVLTNFWGHIRLHVKIQGIQGFFGPFWMDLVSPFFPGHINGTAMFLVTNAPTSPLKMGPHGWSLPLTSNIEIPAN